MGLIDRWRRRNKSTEHITTVPYNYDLDDEPHEPLRRAAQRADKVVVRRPPAAPFDQTVFYGGSTSYGGTSSSGCGGSSSSSGSDSGSSGCDSSSF